MFQKLRIFLRLSTVLLPLAFWRLRLLITARIHKYTYKAVETPKNVVVIGGSFAGWFAAKQLAESLPTGYRVVMIEKHSHFQFTWNFPRSAVVPGQDHKVFIPYPKKPPLAPEGAYVFKQATVVAIDPGKVTLSDGSHVDYEYLAITTGSNARWPADMNADSKAGGMQFFQYQQQRILAAERIVVVGGGAAGVEVAGDIKSKYPDKMVTLVHSREHLLNQFGPKLHDAASKALEAMGITLYLDERVVSGFDVKNATEITLRSGKVLPCDALIRCTGQTPLSNLMKAFAPNSVTPSGSLSVEGTLQLKNSPSSKVFAAGDVIELPGPKLGRQASTQGILMAENIVRHIRGAPLKKYRSTAIDTSIDLTLGIGNNVMYIHDPGKIEAVWPKKVRDVSMHAAAAWHNLAARPFVDQAFDREKVAVVV